MNKRSTRRLPLTFRRTVKYRLVFILGILCLWEALATFGPYSETLFPKVETIVIRFFDLILNENLLLKTGYSLGIVFIALGLSLCISILLIFMGRKYEGIRVNIEMINAIASPLPGIAILPLIILWLGVSRTAMMFIIVHAALWPLWAHLNSTVGRLSRQYSRFAQAFKLTPWQRFYHIYVLGSKPDLMTGLSVAWSRGWRALISVEMIFGLAGSYSGLGWLIYERRMYMDTAGLYAGLLTIAVCGIIFETLIFKSGTEGYHNEKID